jgi:hypothetical protein
MTEADPDPLSETRKFSIEAEGYAANRNAP